MIDIDTGDAIAAIALILSSYSTWATVRFNKRQKSLVEGQEKLNNLMLVKETGEITSELKADLGATFVKMGSSNYRLKIWNKGKARARDVHIEFPEGNDLIQQQEINRIFPLETLDTYQSVELAAYLHFGSPRKLTVHLIWADDFSEKNEKTTHPTI